MLSTPRKPPAPLVQDFVAPSSLPSQTCALCLDLPEKRPKVGLARALKLLLGAVGVLIAVLLTYPISQFMVIMQLRQLCVYQWAEELIPPCQSEIGVVMDDIDRAGGIFARALMWVTEYSELMEAMRLAEWMHWPF